MAKKAPPVKKAAPHAKAAPAAKPAATAKAVPEPAPPGQPQRLAHPFFNQTPAPTSAGSQAVADWAKQKLGPIPAVKGNSTVQLADIIGAPGVSEIQTLGQIRFHCVGDTGRTGSTETEEVSQDMSTDYHPNGGGLNPAFFFHLGDVIYGPNKDAGYLDAFYRPYSEYPGKIIAIPGNHDGEVFPKTDPKSLEAFVTNFCAATAVIPPLADNARIYRETMTQPGVYWWLSCPFIDIIGLYSNMAETQGFIEGENGDLTQKKWLEATMKTIAAQRKTTRKALLIGTHHPPYSLSVHPGSPDLITDIDEACQAAGLMPDAVVSGHAHNYQRHTRRINPLGKPLEIPYVVAGSGGYGLQVVQDAYGQVDGETTFDKAIKTYGYLVITASPQKLTIDFWDVTANLKQPADTVSVDLSTNRLA